MTSQVEINPSINPKKEEEEEENKSKEKTEDKTENKAKNKAKIKEKKRSQRCKHCRKKIPMIFVKCACGHIFCLSHQSPHTHNCSHALMAKEARRDEISKRNPQIKHSTLSDRI